MISRLLAFIITQIDDIDHVVQDHIKSLFQSLYSESFDKILIIIVLMLVIYCYIQNFKIPDSFHKFPTVSSLLLIPLGLVCAICIQLVALWLLYVYYFPYYDQDPLNSTTDYSWPALLLQKAIKESFLFPIDKYITYLFAQWIAIIFYRLFSSRSSLISHQISNSLLFYMIRRMIRFHLWNDHSKYIILLFVLVPLLPRSRSQMYHLVICSSILLIFCLYPSKIWMWLKSDFASSATFYLAYMPWDWKYLRYKHNPNPVWILFAEWTMFDSIELGYSMSFINIDDSLLFNN